MQRFVAIVTTAVLSLGAIAIGAAPAGAAGAVVAVQAVPKGKADARTLLTALRVQKETHVATYQRTRFAVWNDADRDGEDTRAEVLKAESRITASVNRSGTVKGGKWIGAFDNTVVTKASRLDVDHMVPLAEAWMSGAATWSAKKREAFGNDLGYGPSLIAVSLSSNRSKGASDPAEWMPKASSYACPYVKHWIAVKYRWHLTVDAAEKSALLTSLATCATNTVEKPGKPDLAALAAKSKPKSKPEPKQASSGGGSSAGSSSSTYYANCTAVRAAGAAPLRAGQPGYETPRLDRDGDGVACE